ncbi:class A sortase [Latilactobacillus fuchuensis]|uniref:class A sortase n=1 Tax=Latilactobacillus fuchuensis TaxID=164393 RepID=UPI0020C7FFF7|nr:class A sortase [Latilactobacillus fuchuensis]MCP8857529.1 class A sortase [Latilactobacillus fuchuensis]
MSKKVKNRIINSILAVVLIIGLLLVFSGPIRTQVVRWMANRRMDVTAAQIQKNQHKKANFDFKAVDSLDTKQIVHAAVKGDVIVLGKVAVPSVGMALPVMKGVSEDTMAQGGGTMKPDQKMGADNNYALAGHSFSNIFLPLENVKVGDKVYLTDMQSVYTYKVDYKQSISPYDVKVIDDVPGKKMVTLITCDNTVRRWCIQGQLVKTQKATKKTLAVFNP